MSDTATLSLDAIKKGLLSGEYVAIENVPIFDEHDEHDENGQLTQRFDKTRLQKIADVYNRRMSESGDLAPIGPGHTIPGQNVPETMQPPVWGFAGDFRVDTFGPAKKTGILTTLYARADHAEDVRKEFPRRSVELFPNDNLIDWIALLRRSPKRDLGLVAYSRELHEAARKRFCPWEGSPSAFTKDRKPLSASLAGGKLRYAMETNMPDPADPTKEPNVDVPPEAPDPDELQGPDKETAEKFMRHYRKSDKLMRYMCSKYGAEAGLDENPAAQPGAAAGTPPDMGGAFPGPTNGAPPMAQPDKDKERMQRDQEATRYSRLEQEVAQLRAENAAEKKARYQADCERIAVQLESEGYDLDRPTEVAHMATLTPEARDAHVGRIKKHYRRAPVGGALMNLGPPPVQGDAKAKYGPSGNAERFRQVQRYAREHPGVDFTECERICPKDY